jgi:hypothetical protein
MIFPFRGCLGSGAAGGNRNLSGRGAHSAITMIPPQAASAHSASRRRDRLAAIKSPAGLIHIIDPGGVCWHVRQAERAP